MPTLTFRIKKRADADAQLILVREDGSQTYGPFGPADGYGPVHDLTHYVIESTLGLGDGFLGLVAGGWEIKDFEVKGMSKRLSAEAYFAENAAGELSRQLLMRQVSTVEDFLWVLDTQMAKAGSDYRRPEITQQQFDVIVERIRFEWTKWRELPPNGTIELPFSVERRSTVSPPTDAERAERPANARPAHAKQGR
jgi:hypothetical protein